MRILYFLLLIQAALAAILCFGDIGFDKPGKYGLESNAGINLLVLYAVALLLGLALAAKRRRFWWLGVQFLPICFVCAYFLLPDPHFDALRYQFLVGKSKADLVRAVGTPRGAIAGFRRGPGLLDEEFISLRGMTIFLSREGKVLRVEPNDQ